jgi:hypothetical protein
MQGMKRFLVFAILGPALAAMTLLLVVLPLASLLEGTKIEMSVAGRQMVTVYLVSIFPALMVGLFDWIAELIELPQRPIGTAIVGWVLAVLVLRDWLALPDLTGWFVAIGLIGALPAFVCSWVTLKIRQKQSVSA